MLEFATIWAIAFYTGAMGWAIAGLITGYPFNYTLWGIFMVLGVVGNIGQVLAYFTTN